MWSPGGKALWSWDYFLSGSDGRRTALARSSSLGEMTNVGGRDFPLTITNVMPQN
jgi:hypothetical protein